MSKKGDESINPKTKESSHLLLYEKQKYKRNIPYIEYIVQNHYKHQNNSIEKTEKTIAKMIQISHYCIKLQISKT